MSRVPVVHLRPGHVQPVWAGHPWVYAQAVARVEPSTPAPGDEVRVVDPQGNLLGRGFWSARGAIPVRLVVRDETTDLDQPGWIEAKLRAALGRRRALGLPDGATDGFRVVHAEGDGVSGLVVDRFGGEADGTGGTLAVQVGTAGLRRRAAAVRAAIEAVLCPTAVLDRTAATAAKAEGFDLAGSPFEKGTVDVLRFRERGLTYALPTDLGQKTGYYFDQRGLRDRVEALAHGRRVLDAYCYVGSAGLAAARGGASSVLCLDDSLRAIEVGAQVARENGLALRFERADVRKHLPTLAAAGERFDLVVLDPPKLAPTRGDRDAALKYTQRLIESACDVLSPGGLLVVSSCSQALRMGDLVRALAIGARRKDRLATVLERLGQGADHPVPAAFDEGVYLSTAIAELA